ncbi:MAG: hypothetical protein II182_07170, partial [Lachnospiraceae bacterium]|nr:hypothetical protein [Lachnospiraceae bacterium]
MSEQTLTINNLPAPTWNWLRMNDANVRIPAEKLTYIAGEEVPAGITKAVLDAAELSDVASGFGPQAASVFEEVGEVVSYTTTGNIDAPIRLDYDFSEGANCVNAVELHAPEGSSMLVIQNFHSEKNGFGFAGVSTKYDIAKNA